MIKYYNVKVKEYLSQKLIIFYQNSIEVNKKPVKKNISLNLLTDYSYSSLQRTKTTIFDYANSNTFEYFITITFDQKKINRYDYNIISKKLSKQLNNIKQRYSPDFQYLIIPEFHKDGAIHFHGLISNLGFLTKVKKGSFFYIKQFNLGFNSISKIKNIEAISKYITKYITKDMIIGTKNKKRYWVSRNLKKPVETCFLHDLDHIEKLKEYLKLNNNYNFEKKITINDTYLQKIDYFYIDKN